MPNTTKLEVILPEDMAGINRVAVLDFTDAPGADAGYSGRVVAGVVRRYVLGIKDWTLVEREQLDEVWAEHDLQATSETDPQTAVRIGKILGVNGIVIGDVAQYRIGSIPFLFFVAFDLDMYKVDFGFRLVSQHMIICG